jgi:hypothetical protein
MSITDNTMFKPVLLNPLTINPFTRTWIEANIPYNPLNNTSQSENSDVYKGLGKINNNYRYFAFQSRDIYNYFLSKSSIHLMSTEITRKLHGVHPEGKNIIVPDDTIMSVADSMYENNRMDVKVLQEMTINYVVNTIKSEYEMTSNNNKLSAWVQKYDIDSGLTRFNDIKLNRKQRNSYYYWKY